MTSAQQPGWRQRRWFRWPLIGFKAISAFVIGYLLLALMGLFPVNRDFQESENGIEIFVSSSSIRSDIIVPIANASYRENDAFFVANGSYHLFQTCNCWTGNVLENSGVKTGWFTPFPKTPFWYFPDPN